VATLKDAERAREQTSEYLRALGAHAISVEEVPDAGGGEPVAAGEPAKTGEPPGAPGSGTEAVGRPDEVADGGAEQEAGAPGAVGRRRGRRRVFTVVAWFADKPPPTLPERLVVRIGARTKTVPLRARQEERFRPE
jgi:hypothetical protein